MKTRLSLHTLQLLLRFRRFRSANKNCRSLTALLYLIFTWASAVAAYALASPNYVQSNYVVSQTLVRTVTVPYTASQTAGDLNVVVVGWKDSTVNVSSVVDSQENSYQLAARPMAGNGVTQSIYYAGNIHYAAADANVVTINYSAPAAYPDIRVLEYSGIDPMSPTDGTVSATGISSFCTTGTLNTTNANDLLIGANTVKQPTASAESGFTRRILTNPDGALVEELALTATGSFSANVPLRRSGAWVMQLVAFRGANTASIPTELQCLRSMPQYLLEACKPLFPDSKGRVGSNQTNPFEADEQRLAMQGLTVAIGLQDDDYVARYWQAVPYTYSQQNRDGSFAGVSSSAFKMRMWMSWSCHALVLLQDDPRYGPMYSAKLQALLPKIQLSMDYLLANGACTTDMAKTQLAQDVKSPNRSMIIADAFFLGAELLTGYSTPAKIAAYRAMGQQWLDNEFNRSSGANLFRATDAVFLEPCGSISGVDTSYQGLSTTFFEYWIFSNARTGQGTLNNAVVLGERAANFLSKRFQLGQVDDTYNTRSGPGNLEGSDKRLDDAIVRLALMNYNAMYTHPEVLDVVDTLGGEPEVNGLPPNLLTSATFTGKVQTPLSIQVYFTNAGLQSLDSAFRVQITGLPPGLTAKAPTFLGPSTASVNITGTPLAGGAFKALATATNRFGTNPGFNLNFTISPAQ